MTYQKKRNKSNNLKIKIMENSINGFAIVANGFGYTVNVYKVIEEDGGWFCDIDIKKKSDASKFLPEIEFDCMEEKFAMQTTSFGPLNGKDLNEFVMQMQFGVSFTKYAENYDIHKAMLEVNEETSLSEPNKIKFIDKRK